ncbi:SufBD protein [Hespellia stercorisuis]|uniref:SufBD protein n=1 Tax=Hespellia stercorisuis DSM 15480 TaxID=1121950 RepID=A0A1M6MKB5_9FIRM|nr:SufBD protein [Hespellia stercorisuis]SHJ83844.1 hypothetical protein SAMN02745243_01502 [Hespellia stercorisuis DSM 15480]
MCSEKRIWNIRKTYFAVWEGYSRRERYAVRNMEELVSGLTEHDDKQAYRNLQALVNESNCGPDVYVYFHQFVQMMSNPKSYIRTRGITLIAANVKWDEDNRFDEIVAEYLRHVEDDKPITARQCIQTLPTLIRYKPYLKPEVEHALRGISYGKYKESMQSLIQSDVQKVLEKIKSPA